MTLREVANMTPAERKARADSDKRMHGKVLMLVDQGMHRHNAFIRAASDLGVERMDVITGYWQHRRRIGAVG